MLRREPTLDCSSAVGDGANMDHEVGDVDEDLLDGTVKSWMVDLHE